MAGAQRSPLAPTGQPGGGMVGTVPEPAMSLLCSVGPDSRSAACFPPSAMPEQTSPAPKRVHLLALPARSPPPRPPPRSRSGRPRCRGAPRPEPRGDPRTPGPLGLAMMQAHPDGKPWQRGREFSSQHPPPRGPLGSWRGGERRSPAGSPYGPELQARSARPPRPWDGDGAGGGWHTGGCPCWAEGGECGMGVHTSMIPTAGSDAHPPQTGR